VPEEHLNPMYYNKLQSDKLEAMTCPRVPMGKQNQLGKEAMKMILQTYFDENHAKYIIFFTDS
jgi:hypothetical protein